MYVCVCLYCGVVDDCSQHEPVCRWIYIMSPNGGTFCNQSEDCCAVLILHVWGKPICHSRVLFLMKSVGFFVICVLFWRGSSPLLVASYIYPPVSIFHFARTLPLALFWILTKHTIAATAARVSEQGRTPGFFSPYPLRVIFPSLFDTPWISTSPLTTRSSLALRIP